MKVTILQTDIKWCEPAANQARAEELIAKSAPADLYVLPEMWSTGFVTKPQNSAEAELDSMESGSAAWMGRMAKELDAAICGSLAIKTADGSFVNRMYFVHPDGTFVHYDKRHLFTPGSEGLHYTAGTERVVVEFRGVRFLLQVCYDLRFPVWSRCRDDYDAMIYVANWPASRHDVWTTLLKARAIENQSYVIGVNRTGSDKGFQYRGGSMVISPTGETAVDCENTECGMTADIDMTLLRRFRETFPALNDRDSFTINI